MKYYNLSDNEQRELEEIEKTLDKSSPSTQLSPKRKQELEQAAKNTLNKTRNINIRLSERDLYRLKAKAIEEGIPYQTLASSILHKSTAK